MEEQYFGARIAIPKHSAISERRSWYQSMTLLQGHLLVQQAKLKTPKPGQEVLVGVGGEHQIGEAAELELKLLIMLLNLNPLRLTHQPGQHMSGGDLLALQPDL